jgi:hypothetical protein
MGSIYKRVSEGDSMKIILLVITLLIIVGFGGNSVEAASGNIGWSQKLKCDTIKSCPRFVVLKAWDNAAVLDKETGLVWEQSPNNAITYYNWYEANAHCIQLQVSNRMGWRLPTVQELGSLIDMLQENPTLPSGHPFSNINATYWSATTSEVNIVAWAVSLSGGDTYLVTRSSANLAWCVRGGSGVDAQ